MSTLYPESSRGGLFEQTDKLLAYRIVTFTDLNGEGLENLCSQEFSKYCLLPNHIPISRHFVTANREWALEETEDLAVTFSEFPLFVDSMVRNLGTRALYEIQEEKNDFKNMVDYFEAKISLNDIPRPPVTRLGNATVDQTRLSTTRQEKVAGDRVEVNNVALLRHADDCNVSPLKVDDIMNLARA